MDKKYLYMANFADGHPFKAVIEFLRSIIGEAELVFTENKILLREEANNNTVFIEMEINTNDIGGYEYKSTEKQEKFGFNLNNIKNIMTSIGKKDSFRLWKMLDGERMAIQKTSNKNNPNNNAASCDFICCKKIKPRDLPPTSNYDKPTCIVISSVFSEMCKSMGSTKCSVVATGFPNGIIFEAQTVSEISGKRSRFGDCKTKAGEDEFDPDHIEDNDVEYDPDLAIGKITISSGIIKALGKINNFVSSGNSTVQIFMKKDSPLCICSKIGNYGTIRILLRCHCD